MVAQILPLSPSRQRVSLILNNNKTSRTNVREVLFKLKKGLFPSKGIVANTVIPNYFLFCLIPRSKRISREYVEVYN